MFLLLNHFCDLSVYHQSLDVKFKEAFLCRFIPCFFFSDCSFSIIQLTMESISDFIGLFYFTDGLEEYIVKWL